MAKFEVHLTTNSAANIISVEAEGYEYDDRDESYDFYEDEGSRPEEVERILYLYPILTIPRHMVMYIKQVAE